MGDVKWIKLSTDLFSNRKMKQIDHMTDRDSIIVIWVKLLILAGELNDGGEIYFMSGVPFTEEQLAFHLERDREVVALALRTFEAYGMIEIDEGIIRICNWEKYQNAAELEKIREQNRERQARFRGKQKILRDAGICVYCGEKGDTIDHVIARTKGGTDDADNLVCACKLCNTQKNNRDLVVFLNDRLIAKEKVNIEGIIADERLNRYVTYDKETNRFYPITHSSRVTNDTDKIRIDKNREDKIYTSSPDELQRSLLNKWRTNVDGSEANKEIRT